MSINQDFNFQTLLTLYQEPITSTKWNNERNKMIKSINIGILDAINKQKLKNLQCYANERNLPKIYWLSNINSNILGYTRE